MGRETKIEPVAGTMTAIDKVLYLFEKEKGGVGSTGTLITIAHMLMMRGTPVEFIEASISQLDVENAYGGHHAVHRVDLTGADADERVIDIVAEAPEGARIFANVPGGRLAEIEAVHRLVRHANEGGFLSARTEIVWTMGLDAASEATLRALLGGELPGPVHLNLPAWIGGPAEFVALRDDALVEQIEATGGTVFVTPSLPIQLYDRFRRDQIALDRLATTKGVTLGSRVALSQWEKDVVTRLGDLF
ncbi:hypothetical protein [Sphingomonas profundi]|uniref:hypothetical protein n=1 Tax=Alterirhizorhabdus profundi TaxID=2681549 RepID=UPI0012E7F0AD|nr:hypothetical protein [Sphingomonas profundi]